MGPKCLIHEVNWVERTEKHGELRHSPRNLDLAVGAEVLEILVTEE